MNSLNLKYNAATNGRLWKRLTIDSRGAHPTTPRLLRTALKERCDALHKYGRSARIQRVEFIVPQPLADASPGDEDEMLDLLDHIISTLRMCPRLTSLHLKLRHHRRILGALLSLNAIAPATRSFPFQLKTLSSSITIAEGLGPFLNQQQSIKHYSVYRLRERANVESQDHSAAPGGAPRSLCTLSSSAQQAAGILSAWSVRRLELTDKGWKEFGALGGRRFRLVEELTFNSLAESSSHHEWNLISNLEQLSACFPSVTYLGIFTDPDIWPTQVVFDTLAKFRHLRHLSWTGRTRLPNVDAPPHPIVYPGEEEDFHHDWVEQFLERTSRDPGHTVEVVDIVRLGFKALMWERIPVKTSNTFRVNSTVTGSTHWRCSQNFWDAIVIEHRRHDGTTCGKRHITPEETEMSESESMLGSEVESQTDTESVTDSLTSGVDSDGEVED